VIALMNQKGGVGKTTTTVNLGAALAEAEAGRRVLLVDLDPQAHLTLHVGLDPAALERSVYDLLIDGEVPADSVVRTAEEGLDVIPAEVDLAGAEQELSGQSEREAALKRKLAPIAERYDFILLDCPPSLGLLTVNALAAAGEVLVPMQAHFLALQGLSKLLETVQLVRQNVNTSLQVAGVVLCVHDAQTNLAAEVVRDLEQFFEASRKLAMPWSDAVTFRPPIRRNIRLAECPSFGQTVLRYAPKSAGAADYRRLARQLAGEIEPAQPEPQAQQDQAEETAPAAGTDTEADANTDAGDGTASDAESDSAEADRPGDNGDAVDSRGREMDQASEASPGREAPRAAAADPERPGIRDGEPGNGAARAGGTDAAGSTDRAGSDDGRLSGRGG
jgi:chromosome partitioning protein